MTPGQTDRSNEWEEPGEATAGRHGAEDRAPGQPTVQTWASVQVGAPKAAALIWTICTVPLPSGHAKLLDD